MPRKPVNCWITRDRKGTKVRIEVFPEIEEFFKRWGGGLQEPPTHGRLWKALDEKQPLRLWTMEIDNEDGAHSNLLRSGTALIDKVGKNVNISFLRLVGAGHPRPDGEPGGREFLLDIPMSTTEIEKASAQIVKAGTAFYHEYIRPININCFVGIVDHSEVSGGR